MRVCIRLLARVGVSLCELGNVRVLLFSVVNVGAGSHSTRVLRPSYPLPAFGISWTAAVVAQFVERITDVFREDLLAAVRRMHVVGIVIGLVFVAAEAADILVVSAKISSGI